MPTMIELTCVQCGNSMIKELREFNSANKRGRKIYCSRTCANKANIKPIPERTCEQCQKTFYKKDHHGSPQRFCSTSCANSNRTKETVECLNCNKHFIKSQSKRFCSFKCQENFKQNNKKIILNQDNKTNRLCIKCNKEKVPKRKRICDICYANSVSFQNEDNKIKNLSLQQLRDITTLIAFHNKLRVHSRSVFINSGQLRVCVNCGYSKRVDVCHVKDVKDFSPDTLVSVVNDISNLVPLCPRDHWEFDHGLLELC